MDRNHAMQIIIVIMYAVALRKESVDRNKLKIIYRTFRDVALRKESVDRNPIVPAELTTLVNKSLSARRAWIEIL